MIPPLMAKGRHTLGETIDQCQRRFNVEISLQCHCSKKELPLKTQFALQTWNKGERGRCLAVQCCQPIVDSSPLTFEDNQQQERGELYKTEPHASVNPLWSQPVNNPYIYITRLGGQDG